MKISNMTIEEAIDAAMLFNPIKIYYNRKIVWDDDLSEDKGWVNFDSAVKSFKSRCKDYDKIVVTNVKIKIVHFHHSIVYLKGKIKNKENNNGTKN